MEPKDANEIDDPVEQYYDEEERSSSHRDRLESLWDAWSHLADLLGEERERGDSPDVKIEKIILGVLVKIADAAGDEKSFLSLAKSAYRLARGNPKRGRKNLKDQCWRAMEGGHAKLKLGLPAKHWMKDFCERYPGMFEAALLSVGGKEALSSVQTVFDLWTPHHRPSQGQLVKMIRDRVKDPKTGKPISERRARPYAQQWESEMYKDKLTVPERIRLHHKSTS